MMWYWSGGMHWWGWLLGMVGMLAFWGLIIWAVWYLVAGPIRGDDRSQGPGDAKRILDERLARGDISPEEYRHLLGVIRGDLTRATNGQSHAATGSQR
jgi:putative membrane protein